MDKKYLSVVRDQLTESHTYDEVFKTSSLSISTAELYEQHRNIQARLKEVLERKVEEYNGLSDSKLAVKDAP